ncbi:MAG: thiamine phosphate synthase [Nannocystaceae bacterium]
MPRPPLRLLAITPPQGSVDAALVDTWGPARRVGLGLLLREPAAPLVELLSAIDRGRLRAVHRRAVSLGIPLLASLDAGEIERALPQLRALDLAGVQLRGDPSPEALAQARAALPTAALLGRSCHGLPSAASAAGHELVDYTCLAPIFAPSTAQPGVHKRAIGLDPLRRWADPPSATILALGGVGPQTADACLDAGAAGLAGIGLFFGDPARVGEDVAAVVASLDRHARDVRPLSQR